MVLDFLAGCAGGVKRVFFYLKILQNVFTGCSGVLVAYPLDTVKVKLQVRSDHRYKGTIHCLTSTVKLEGVRGLYKG
jgi:hypothetical protein